MSRDDIPTLPVAYERDFADTQTPEDYYTDSVRGLLDDEFSADAPRDPPTFIDRAVLVVVFLAGLIGIWSAIDSAVRFFGG